MDNRSGVAKRSKGYQTSQTILYRQRRVGQDIGNVCITQQAHVSTHVQSIQRPFHCCPEIGKDFSVDQTLTSAFGIQKRIVLRQQIQIRHRSGHIPEINRSVNREWSFSCCIDSEFIKFQPIILYLYRTVVEPEISTILAGKNRNAIQYQFAIYQRLLGATRNIQITIHITGQRSHFIRNKYVSYT